MPVHGAGGSTHAPASAPRVCLLTETFHPVVGGGETHAKLLAGHLNRLGMESFVLTRRVNADLPVAEEVEGIRVRRVPPTGMKRFGKYFMLPAVARELNRRRDEYDVILVCGFRVLGGSAVSAAHRLGKTCVLRAEMQGELSGGYASAYQGLPPVVGGIFSRWTDLRNRQLLTADAFVSIGDPLTEEFLNCGVASEKIARIPNGIDTGAYRPVDPSLKKTLRRKLGLTAHGSCACYSGKLNRGKGLEYLLDAWERLLSERDDLYLVLVGSGGGQSLSIEDQLRRFVQGRGLGDRIKFTGYVSNVAEYLQASDLFVFPSENEALPMAVLEAMACGLPVIATRVGGIPEAVRHMESGILINPSDAGEITRAVESLLPQEALMGRLSDAARRTVRDRYSIEAVAKRYYELFCSLHEERKAA